MQPSRGHFWRKLKKFCNAEAAETRQPDSWASERSAALRSANLNLESAAGIGWIDDNVFKPGGYERQERFARMIGLGSTVATEEGR
jgi:hypothetical protein